MLGPGGIVIGIVSIVVGLLVLFWPDVTLWLVAILFGIQLIIQGAMRIGFASRARGAGWPRGLSIAVGILVIIAGILCLLRPAISLIALAYLLAIGWIIEGIATLTQAFGHGRATSSRIFFGISGVVFIAAGVIVAIAPGSSLVLLAQVAGVALIIIGVFALVAAIAHRREGHRPAGSTGTRAAPSPL